MENIKKKCGGKKTQKGSVEWMKNELDVDVFCFGVAASISDCSVFLGHHKRRFVRLTTTMNPAGH